MDCALLISNDVGWRFQFQVWESSLSKVYSDITGYLLFYQLFLKQLVTTYSSRYNRSEYVQNYTQIEVNSIYTYIIYFHILYIIFIYIYISIIQLPLKGKITICLKRSWEIPHVSLTPALGPQIRSVAVDVEDVEARDRKVTDW